MKMKWKAFAAVIAIMGLTASCQNRQSSHQPSIPSDKDVESQVEKILSRLTLEEKIGQMCELTIDAIQAMGQEGFQLDEEKLKLAFDTCKVGSILNVPLGMASTPEVWYNLIHTINLRSEEQCNGVPQIYGVDQIHGASYCWGATFFPQEINQAASFNRAIPYRVNEIAAYESRACLIPWVYSPVMDLGRNPAWPRMWESYGEDSYLNAEMAVQAVKGYQGDDPNHIDANHVAACLKHYMAYGVALSGKDRTPSYIPDRELKEKYFEPFKRCVEAGALSLMVNSGNNSGEPFHASHKFLTEWLKEGLNWDGMIVTDWADIENLYSRDHVAASKKEAIEMAINAGIDMSMDPYNVNFCRLLKESVDEGKVSMDRINDAVRRILRLKVRVGLFDKNTWDVSFAELQKQYPDYGSEKFDQEATRMAEETMVLLKNENEVLPLKPGAKILVTGPNANSFQAQNGGWSYNWQGTRADEACLAIGKYHTFYQALAEKLGAENVKLVEGITYQNVYSKSELENEPNIPAAVAAARGVDVILAFVGENSYAETPGNINDLTLSQNQQNLVKALAATGKPVVMVLNEGRPRIIREIEPLCQGVIDAFLPGNYGGDALANLLTGEANFSAKMPFTYPKYVNSFATYDYKPCENVATMDGAYNYDAVMDVQYPFGAGLSYTTYAYSNLKADKEEFLPGDEITFSVDVKNTGNVAGSEPVLLFISDMVATLTPDVKRLRGFEKVSLQPGESTTVSMTVKANDLAFVDNDGDWLLEEGDFRAAIGDQHITFRCNATKKVLR